MSGANAIPTAKNLLCFKALVNFCYRYGGLLAEPGWTIALRAFQCLERTLQKAPSVPNSDLAALRQARLENFVVLDSDLVNGDKQCLQRTIEV
eukprot:g2725.t1